MVNILLLLKIITFALNSQRISETSLEAINFNVSAFFFKNIPSHILVTSFIKHQQIMGTSHF